MPEGNDSMKKPLPAVALALLFRQLASANARSIPFDAIVAIIADDRQLPNRAKVRFGLLLAALRAGAPLIDSLEAASPMVSPSEADLLRLAEKESELTLALNILAADSELRQRDEDLYRLALVWPSAVLCVLSVSFLVSAAYTVPAFESMFRNDATEMPFAAHALVLFSNFFVGFPLLILAVVIIGAIGVTLLGRWPESVRNGIARLVLVLPAAQRFYQSKLSSRTANVLCKTINLPGLRHAGITMVASSAGRGRFAGSLKVTADQLRTNPSRSDAFAPIRDDLPRIYLYCRLAEATGDTAAVMGQLSELVSQDEAIATARFERALLISCYLVVGLLVAAFVISMYSAMSSMPYAT